MQLLQHSTRSDIFRECFGFVRNTISANDRVLLSDMMDTDADEFSQQIIQNMLQGHQNIPGLPDFMSNMMPPSRPRLEPSLALKPYCAIIKDRQSMNDKLVRGPVFPLTYHPSTTLPLIRNATDRRRPRLALCHHDKRRHIPRPAAPRHKHAKPQQPHCIDAATPAPRHVGSLAPLTKPALLLRADPRAGRLHRRLAYWPCSRLFAVLDAGPW